MRINKQVLDELTLKAKESPRLRMNLDLRTSPHDNSQRMLNALEPGTVLPIHRHQMSTEVVVILRGSATQYFYDDLGNVTEDVTIKTGTPECGMSVEKGRWHKLVSDESGTVIFEAKDGRYGEDESETFDEYQAKKSKESPAESSEPFYNSLGDLKKNIEYLIGMERRSGSMEVITPLFVSRMLNVSIEEVEKVMRENFSSEQVKIIKNYGNYGKR